MESEEVGQLHPGRTLEIGLEILHRAGALDAFRYAHRKDVLVLTYHDILPKGFPEQNPLFGMSVAADEFAWHLAHLHEKFNPISFQQFLEWFIHGAQLPERAVLITVDDGHRSIRQHALPLLKQRNTPAVCFVLAENLGETALLWFEEAYYRILFSKKTSLKLCVQNAWGLENTEQRNEACRKMFLLFRTMSEDEQRAHLEQLRRQLPIPEGELQFRDRFEFLSSDDLRLLGQNNIEIAAHSLTHPILASLTPDTAKREIFQSKQRLEKVLGVPVRSFAYPFGTPEHDFGLREQELVEECGYCFGFTGKGGFVMRRTDRFALPRMSIGTMCRARFVATVAGALSSLKSLLQT